MKVLRVPTAHTARAVRPDARQIVVAWSGVVLPGAAQVPSRPGLPSRPPGVVLAHGEDREQPVTVELCVQSAALEEA
jgi:hypothetical protein